MSTSSPPNGSFGAEIHRGPAVIGVGWVVLALIVNQFVALGENWKCRFVQCQMENRG